MRVLRAVGVVLLGTALGCKPSVAPPPNTEVTVVPLPPEPPATKPPATNPPTIPSLPPSTAVGPKPTPVAVLPPKLPGPVTPPEPTPMPVTPEKPATPEKPPEPPPPFKWPDQVGGKSLDDWIKESRSADPAIRQSSAENIAKFGPEAARRPAFQDLLKLTRDLDPGVRINAMTCLAFLHYEDKEEQKQILVAIHKALEPTIGGSVIRSFGIQALAAYGADAGDVPEVLLAMEKVSTDPWWETRKTVASALGRVGAPEYADPPAKDTRGRPAPKKLGNADGAQKILRRMMAEDKSAAVRLEAVFSMISIGPPYVNPEDYAAAVKPNLEAVHARLGLAFDKKGKPIEKPSLDKEKVETDKVVQIWLYFLNAMYDESAFPRSLGKVAGGLQDPSMLVRVQALNALTAFGPRAAPEIDKVIECLALYKDNPLMLTAVLGCIIATGKDAEKALPMLDKLKGEVEKPEMKELVQRGIDAIKGKKPEEKGTKPPEAKP